MRLALSPGMCYITTMPGKYQWIRDVLEDEQAFHRIVSKFFSQIDFIDDCWIWFGTTNTNGYGIFPVANGKMVNAHTFSAVLHRKMYKPGDVSHHICKNRPCVNPEHIEVMNQSDHMKLHHEIRRKERETQIDQEMKTRIKENLA